VQVCTGAEQAKQQTENEGPEQTVIP